ncbi:hypothetical protein [Amycolatopsis anabasis]|uniref:hypothetical protein n=1 Tax=Amycolatopsis anabasis TaxID=1840409 RepID=UPI00131D415B|nr:hypothetical protein [Amycolatopsis anabasis]
MRTWLRAGLAALTLIQLGLGGWILSAPRSFFALPWVNMHMAYNEHLMLDYGAMNLALAVILGAATIVTERRLVVPALLAYLVFSAAHVVIHTRYLGHLPPGQSAALLSLLSLGAVIPLVLLYASRRLAANRPAR